MGSAALFFGTHPAQAILSDLNLDLVETFSEVAKNPDGVAQYLGGLPNTKEDYYRIRSIEPSGLLPIQRAARFIYLNRFCFNGLYRTNTKGEFNVPYGRPKNDNRPNSEELRACSRLLKNAEIHCGDFEDVVRNNVKPGDLVYLDPPFAITTKRVFREYDRSSFSPDDLSRLLALLQYIDRRGARFVLSYAHTAKSSALFAEWPSSRIFVQRNISGFANFRRKSVELIVSNQDFLSDKRNG